MNCILVPCFFQSLGALINNFLQTFNRLLRWNMASISIFISWDAVQSKCVERSRDIESVLERLNKIREIEFILRVIEFTVKYYSSIFCHLYSIYIILPYSRWYPYRFREMESISISTIFFHSNPYPCLTLTTTLTIHTPPLTLVVISVGVSYLFMWV